MNADYRTAPHTEAEPNETVVYRPLGRWIPWFVTAMMMLFSFMIMALALTNGTAVRVTCGHDEKGGSCIVATTMPVLGQSTQIVPLASIRDVRLTSKSSKKGTSWTVVLVTTSGELPLSLAGATDRAQRERVAAQLREFLGDPAHPSIDLIYDVGDPRAGYFLFLMFVPLLVIAIVFRRVDLEFEWGLGRLRIQRRRWPLRRRTDSYALDDVRGARVNARPGSKGGAIYSVVVDLVSGGDVALTTAGSSSEGEHRRTADEVNARLRRWRSRRDG